MKRSLPIQMGIKKYIVFSIVFSLMGCLLFVGNWYQVLGAKAHVGSLPHDLVGLTVEGQTNLPGIIYFDATKFGTDGRPGTPGNYLMEYDTTTQEFTAKRMVGNGLQYQRHSDYLLSYYELPPNVVYGQSQGYMWSGIPTQNGGYFRLLNAAGYPVGTIEDDRGLDLHELEATPEGNYIYLVTDQRVLYQDPTITCLMTCYMFGQAIVEVTPDRQELYRYDLLDYYERDDFVMDDVFSLEDTKLYDLTHANSVYLHNNLLIVSVRHANEVLAIHRDTGEIVWRTHDMEFVNDGGFSHQHDAHITEDDTLLLFDNANGKDRKVSRAVEYQIDGNQLIKVWEYENEYFRPNRGSARRLPDGSTLINFVTHIELVKDDEPILTITLPEYYTSYQADWFSS